MKPLRNSMYTLPVLLVLAGLHLGGCFSGVKRVGDGEPCVSGNQILSGDVVCADGLVCFPDGRQGVCTRTCAAQFTCAPDRVCATGVCVQPCSSWCDFSFSFSVGVCCQLPAEGVEACLPLPACAGAGGTWDSGTDSTSGLDAGVDS